MRYELFYLIGGSKEAELPKIKEEVMSLVISNGGVFEEKETLEKRKLAYQVKHENQGIYIAQRFEMENKEGLSDINTKLNLNTGVLRFIISKAAELPELKTKEERIKEAADAQSLQEKRAEKEEKILETKKKTVLKPQEAQKSPEKKAPTETAEKSQEKVVEESQSQQDLDKKLEEILNI